MLVSVDGAGRVVIPKEAHERLGLTPDTPLELATDGDTIHLTPLRTDRRRVVEVDGLLVLEPVEGHAITDVDVSRWRDADQR